MATGSPCRCCSRATMSRVYRFVLRLVRNEATAEDLISDVFLDVWRQAGKFEGRSAVSTWLLSIARFKALSVLRRRPEEELDDETAGAIEDHSDDPEIALAKKDKGAAMRECLNELSAEHRESSISSTTTRNRWRKSRPSSAFRRQP